MAEAVKMQEGEPFRFATSKELPAPAGAVTVGISDRPTPEEIDHAAQCYLAAKEGLVKAKEDVDWFEKQCIDMVTNYGIVPPHAEKSRRLNGRLAEMTVTKGDVLTINDERVETLKDALEANAAAISSPSSSRCARSGKWSRARRPRSSRRRSASASPRRS